MKTFTVMNGPNLNRLGAREPDIYGKRTSEDLTTELEQLADQHQCRIELKQSNHEGEIIDWLHEAETSTDGVVVNAGAFTHYSYAIRDAIGSISIPVIEVHLSNIHARETFRHQSVISPVVSGQIVGLGFLGYTLAVQALLTITENKPHHKTCQSKKKITRT